MGASTTARDHGVELGPLVCAETHQVRVPEGTGEAGSDARVPIHREGLAWAGREPSGLEETGKQEARSLGSSPLCASPSLLHRAAFHGPNSSTYSSVLFPCSFFWGGAFSFPWGRWQYPLEVYL